MDQLTVGVRVVVSGGDMQAETLARIEDIRLADEWPADRRDQLRALGATRAALLTRWRDQAIDAVEIAGAWFDSCGRLLEIEPVWIP